MTDNTLMDDGGAEERQKLEDDLFSKVDNFLEHEAPFTGEEYGDALDDIDVAVDACLPSLADADEDGEPPGLTGDVAALLILHARWMRRRQKQERV